MKHRRAGPQKKPTGGRSPRATPEPRRVRKAKAKAVPFKPKPKVPQPIGPWVAMREMLSTSSITAPVIFDVGAHWGNVTDYFLKVWPAASIYCFEPEPMGLKKLHERFDGNEQVTIVPLALGSRQGNAKFHLCGQGTEMSSLLPRGDYLGRRYYRHEVRETIEVPVTTVDAFMDEHDIEDVHLMKVDVQGGEKLVFRGARAGLASGSIWAIYSEVLFVSLYEKCALFWEICRQLDKLDMTLFDIYGLQRSWINRQLKYGDALFIGPALRKVVNSYPEEWLRKSLEHRMCPGR